MTAMVESLLNFFSTTQFIPHGHCYLWKPGLVWLHVVSDLLTALAYYSIPVTLVYFVRKRRDLPFDWIFLLFGAFIVACGTTHIIEVWTLWHPLYWLSGFIKAITATVSLFVGVQLVLLVPLALALPSPAQLEVTNQELLSEIVDRKRAEKLLREMQNQLEVRVRERTLDLIKINESLQAEISDRQRIELALRESEAKYRRLIETAAEGIWILDACNNTTFVNLKMAEMLGYTVEETLGMPWFTFMDAEGQSISVKNIERRKQGIAEQQDFKFRRKDGSDLWALISTNPILDCAGQYIGALGMITDITERRGMELALRESEERLNRAILNAPLPIAIHAEDGEILQISKTWTEITGYTHNDIPTIADWTEKAYKQTKELVQAGIKQLYNLNERVTEGEYTINTLYGESRIWDFSSAPLGKLPDGRRLVISIAMDVSDRKRAEEQVKASLAEKEVLLKEIHHRVKNNLQIISSLLNLQTEYLKDNQAIEIFKVSQKRIESMALIHEKLYKSEDLARINFAEYIQDLVASLFCSYETNAGAITLKINVDEVLLDIDTAICCGLIVNELVLNSLKHAFPSKKSGEIGITGINSADDNQFTLIISDNGIGLPPNIEFDNTETLGLQLVNILINQLKATTSLDTNNGVKVEIKFAVKPKY